MAFARGGRMNEDNLFGLIAFIVITGLAFGSGLKIGINETTTETNQKICKQLYIKDTNKYINCSTKDINENIKLIKDITNDR